MSRATKVLETIKSVEFDNLDEAGPQKATDWKTLADASATLMRQAGSLANYSKNVYDHKSFDTDLDRSLTYLLDSIEKIETTFGDVKKAFAAAKK